MPIMALDHVQLAMPPDGEAKAQAFYGDLLGMPEVSKPAHLARRGGCWFELGEVKLHLGVHTEFRPARKAHAAFLVDDLHGLSRSLAAAGHVARKDGPLAGYEWVYVDDPFGNRIELMERMSAPVES